MGKQACSQHLTLSLPFLFGFGPALMDIAPGLPLLPPSLPTCLFYLSPQYFEAQHTCPLFFVPGNLSFLWAPEGGGSFFPVCPVGGVDICGGLSSLRIPALLNGGDSISPITDSTGQQRKQLSWAAGSQVGTPGPELALLGRRATCLGGIKQGSLSELLPLLTKAWKEVFLKEEEVY